MMDGCLLLVPDSTLDLRCEVRPTGVSLSLSHFGELIVMESHAVAEGGIDPDVARH